MKKAIENEKIFKIIILSFFLFLLYAYWGQFFFHENFDIILVNETKQSEVKVQVWIDDESVFDNSVLQFAPSIVSVHEKFGSHNVVVYRYDTNVSKKVEVDLVLMKWVEFRLKDRPDTIMVKERIIPKSYF